MDPTLGVICRPCESNDNAGPMTTFPILALFRGADIILFGDICLVCDAGDQFEDCEEDKRSIPFPNLWDDAAGLEMFTP